MTAHELARLLLTYPDLPMRVALVGDRDGDEVTYLDASDNVRCEIQTDHNGTRHVTVLANDQQLADLAWT